MRILIKHCLLLFLFVRICFVPSIFAQDLSSLSDIGYGHWIVASELDGDDASVDDLILAAEEYEQVICSDSHYAPALLNLARVYKRIGSVYGSIAFEKAYKALTDYHSLNPGDNRTYEAELASLRATQRKYIRNVTVEGVWTCDKEQIVITIEKVDGEERWITKTVQWKDKKMVRDGWFFGGECYGGSGEPKKVFIEFRPIINTNPSKSSNKKYVMTEYICNGVINENGDLVISVMRSVEKCNVDWDRDCFIDCDIESRTEYTLIANKRYK